MEIIRNIFSAHSRLSPAARKAWEISRRLFKGSEVLTRDIETLIAIDSEGIAPFRMALEHDGNRHGSARREAIVDAIHNATTNNKQHIPTTIALLASFIDDQEGMVGSKAVAHLAGYGPRVDGLLLKALHDGNRWTRSYAVRALGEFGGIRAVPSLIRALQDDDERVRSDAAEALGKLGDAQATQPLFGALTDPNWLVRESASSALASLSDQEMVDKLTLFLQDDDPRVRAQAVRTLGNINSPAALSPLIAALDDHHFEVQWDAIEALTTPDNHQAVLPLITHYHQGDKELRSRILTACTVIGIPHVSALLTHSDTNIRSACAELLGQQQSPEPLHALVEAWQQENDHGVQMWIIIAIGQLTMLAGKSSPDHAIHALIDGAKSNHRSVRYHAIKALESLHHPLAEQFIEQPIRPTKIAIACPNCLRRLNLQPPLTNKQWHCPQCNLGFTIRQGAKETLIVAPITAFPTTPPSSIDSTHWFKILQVERNASADTIQQAFRTLLKQYHPDRVAGLGAEFQQLAEEKTRQLTQALRTGLELNKQKNHED